jgi:hypothetical protein
MVICRRSRVFSRSERYLGVQQLRDVFPGDGPYRFMPLDHDSTFDGNVIGFQDFGRTKSVHAPATTRSVRRRLGEGRREIENQQLLLDEYGLGHQGTRATRPRGSGDGRHEVEKQRGQVAHGTS